ncbi:MAG: hypothetical protein AAF570_24955, partial [Bacteroidota bacterium]
MSPQYYYLAFLPDTTKYSFAAMKAVIAEAFAATDRQIEFEPDDSMAKVMAETGLLGDDGDSQDAILLIDGYPLMLSFERGPHVKEDASALVQRIG